MLQLQPALLSGPVSQRITRAMYRLVATASGVGNGWLVVLNLTRCEEDAKNGFRNSADSRYYEMEKVYALVMIWRSYVLLLPGIISSLLEEAAVCIPR